MARQPVYRGQFDLGKLFRSLLILVTACVFVLYTAPSEPDCFDDDAPYATSAAWMDVHADSGGNRKAPSPKVQRLIIDPSFQSFSSRTVILPEYANAKKQQVLGADKIRDPPAA